jgi:hypothetical protein
MRATLSLARIITLGFFAIFAHEAPANASTFEVPYGASTYTFSIATTAPGYLVFSPVVNIATNGCPNSGCPSSMWEDSFSANLYNQAGTLLASDAGNVEENCTPSNCTVPTSVFVPIAPNTAYFELFNDVTVSGGWSFTSATMTIDIYQGGESQISETPLPASLPLLATGLSGLGILGWRKKRKCKRVT